MRIALVALLVLCLVVLPACQMNERMSGTAMGAVGGGTIGALVGGWAGAAIGVVAGGVAGYVVGDYLADKRECGRCGVFGSAAPSSCDPCAPPPCGPGGQVQGIKEYAAPTPAAAPSAAKFAYERGRKADTATEARRHFEESARLDPRRPEAWNALGLNALYRGDRVEAERLWRVSLAQDSSYYAAQHNLARLGQAAPTR